MLEKHDFLKRGFSKLETSKLSVYSCNVSTVDCDFDPW